MICFSHFVYLIAIIAALLVIYFKNYLRALLIALKLPGPPNALPVIGHVHLIANTKEMIKIANEMPQKYGPIMKAWVSIVPFFLITEPDHLQMLLGNNKTNTKHWFYSLLHNFIGNGLITNSGAKWKEHRKLMQAYFHVNYLKCFFEHFVKCAKSMTQSLEDQSQINVAVYANKFVLDVLHGSVLGIENNNVEDSPFRKGKLFVPYRISRPWLLFDYLFKLTQVSKEESNQKGVLQAYTEKILNEKLKNRKSHSSDNFMEILIEIASKNPGFTKEDIINETCTLMLAGQDSVGAAMAFTLHFLAKHQEAQERVVEELTQIFNGTNRDETFKDLAEMKYLEQCIKETMRLCPSVPIITRTLTQSVQFSKKYILPKGSNIFISPFVTHRMPHIFPNPLCFDPDRFSAENIGKMHPFAYLPFSAGPRNCIGYKFALNQMKVALSQVLRNYHLTLAPGHEDIDLAYRITLRAKGGVWLIIKRRN